MMWWFLCLGLKIISGEERLQGSDTYGMYGAIGRGLISIR